MKVRSCRRMNELVPYLFFDLERKQQEARKRGVEVIALSIGDPDLPTPREIVKAGQAALADPANHRYPEYAGSASFRQAAAAWMQRRFGVELDPDEELAALIGTKEGIAHLALALVDRGDVVLCPEPAYPVYAVASRLAGGEVYHLPLVADRNFLPDLDAISADAARRAKLLWINYPNNPTGAVAPLDFLERAVAFAHRHQCVLGVDCAYSEIAFDGEEVHSVFELPGAREVAVEFHSLSKTYNMTGWRVGFIAGNREVVRLLSSLKSNLDSGVFQAIQVAGIAAMKLWPRHLGALLETYRRRRGILVSGLGKAGFQPIMPRGTFYVWMPVPQGDDLAFASRLLEEAGVLVAPGSGFGSSGKGYVRFSLTAEEGRLQEAVNRIQRAGISG